MILNVSGRTDVVAFYSDWFMNRYKEGFLDVRNPFNKKLVSRIYFDDVDLILFCTKNPIPIIDKLKYINKPILFQVTLTPYRNDIEPNVIDKNKIIDAIKEISKIVGIDNLTVRYDPIFLSDKYNLEYHIKAFKKLCDRLDGYVNRILISFMDEYKNVKNNRNVLRYRPFNNDDYRIIGREFSLAAKSHNINVFTCSEKEDLVKFGFSKDECLSHSLAFKLTGKKYKGWKARGNINCKCVEMVDVGVYNSCSHFCKYCYANFDEASVRKNYKLHDKTASLLIGKLEKDDVIKIRRK